MGDNTTYFQCLAGLLFVDDSGRSCALKVYFELFFKKVICAIKAKVCSYQELAEQTYGKRFRLFVNVVLFFANLGTIVLYLKMVNILL